jgi:hypothetical protein
MYSDDDLQKWADELEVSIAEIKALEAILTSIAESIVDDLFAINGTLEEPNLMTH